MRMAQMSTQQSEHKPTNTHAENHRDLLVTTKNVLIEDRREPDCRRLQHRKPDDLNGMNPIGRRGSQHLDRMMHPMKRPQHRHLVETHMRPIVDQSCSRRKPAFAMTMAAGEESRVAPIPDARPIPTTPFAPSAPDPVISGDIDRNVSTISMAANRKSSRVDRWRYS